MSRITHIEGVDNNIKVIPPHLFNEEKIVIIDADTLKFTASYTGYNENGVKNPDYTEEQYEIAEGILTDWVMKILNHVEEYFKIKEVFLCVKGNNNFRKEIFKDYKANRPTPLPIIEHLHKYLVNNHQAIEAPKGEADDLVYTLSNKIDNSGIIVGVDKDLLQIPSIHYDFKKDKWQYIDKKQAKYNFWTQVLVGDNGDNIKFSPSIGKKYAEKHLNIEFNDCEYLKAAWVAYKKAHKNDKLKAKEALRTAIKLIKLYNIEEYDK